MKKLKYCKAFTIIELLIVMVILGILVLIIPNLDMFYLNAVKKEGVLLVRTIIEQERVYKADNGKYYTTDDDDTDNTRKKSVQNWKPIKTLLIDNKYFNADVESDGKIGYSDANEADKKFSQVIQKITSDNNGGLIVEVKASPKLRAAGWHIKGHLIEGKDLRNKNKDVVNKIIFEEGKEENGSHSVNSWKEIVL